MLHAVAELGEDRLRHVERVLGDEIDADALGTDEAHHLLDLLDQGLRRVLEQEMGLVEEEDELRLVDVADLGEFLEELRQQPQQEGRVELRARHQLVGGQQVDVAAPFPVGAHQVLQRQRRLAEELRAALVLQRQQLALDGADGGGRDVAVGGAQLVLQLLVRSQLLQHGAQVLQVEERQAVLVGIVEEDVDHAFLGLVEIHQAGEQQRPHLGDGGADGVALLAEEVPEDHGELVGVPVETDLLGAFEDEGLFLAHGGDAGEVTLDVGGEDRDAGRGEPLGEDLQRHRLAGAGGAGDQAVAVAELQRKPFLLGALAEEEGVVGHDLILKLQRCGASVLATWPADRQAR